MTRSQAVVGQELLELALVLGVELLREVGGHVGQEAGPEAGGCAQGAGDLVLLLGGADNPRHVDLDVRDLRHEGEHAPCCAGHGGGEEGASHGRAEDGDDGHQGGEAEPGQRGHEVLSATDTLDILFLVSH